MSDFAQNGLICTLQRLNDANLPQIETELRVLAEKCPITLILPCHASDLARPALAHICTELAGADWLHEIILSLNGLNHESAAHASTVLRAFQRARVLWNDGPALAQIYASLLGCEEKAVPHGKGLNVWAAAGLAYGQANAEILVTQDCDVSSFSRGNLARLCYACAHPRLGFSFGKMYYSRVTDRLYGRVTRLFLAPLLQALVRVAGHQPLLDFLLSFRYPLAGECAIRRSQAGSIAMEAGWGLEIGLLCELFRSIDPREVCQVDGGSGYDHKHQPVAAALESMCREIGEALFRQLASEGVRIDAAFRETMTAAYRKESRLALQRSAALAFINGLPFDQEQESAIVEAFGAALESVDPMAPGVTLPSWARLAREQPDNVAKFLGASSCQHDPRE